MPTSPAQAAVRFAGDAVELLYDERVASTNLGGPLTATDELVVREG